MPGPGGGARGGGGGRGGFGGGGFGGGFGGGRGGFGHGPHFHGPHHGYWGHGRYYGGGSCLGGLIGIIMLPIIVVVVGVIFLFSFLNGSLIIYDEDKMQDYAYAQYVQEFGAPEAADAYEDNLLIVFLADETATEYYYIAFVGDNIKDEVADLFGGEYTALGNAFAYEIPMDYEYSLSGDLAAVMETMAVRVKALGLESPYYDQNDHSGAVESHLTNHSSLPLNEATVQRGLTTFTEETGIPAVIVVGSVVEVLGVGPDSEGGGALAIGLPILFAVVLIVAAVFIVRAMRKRDQGKNNGDRQYPPTGGQSGQGDGML